MPETQVRTGPVHNYTSAKAYTTMSERLLRDEYRRGRLKGFHVGRAVRFHKEDLDAWLDMLRAEEAKRQDKRRARRPVAGVR